MMKRKQTPAPKTDGQAGTPTLKIIMNAHAEETISDEQVARVLGPIQKRILAGEFDRPPRKRQRVSILGAMAAALVVLAFAVYPQQGADTSAPSAEILEIQSPQIPLAGRPFSDDTMSVQALLTLVNERSLETICLPDGENMHAGIPDGIWRVVVTLNGESRQTGRLVVADGTTKLIPA